jgi:hypothetical protein
MDQYGRISIWECHCEPFFGEAVCMTHRGRLLAMKSTFVRNDTFPLRANSVRQSR